MSTKAFMAQLDRVLNPLGFKRQKATWNRKVALVVEVIDVQVSKAGDRITVNAGVLDPEVHTGLWGAEPSFFVTQPRCTVGVRVGELIDGRDKWWPLSDNAAVVEVAEKVVTYVVPFLEQMRAREAMERWLMDTEVAKKRWYPPPIINLAIIKSLSGETAEACTLLGDLQKKAIGTWHSKVAEVAERLGYA